MVVRWSVVCGRRRQPAGKNKARDAAEITVRGKKRVTVDGGVRRSWCKTGSENEMKFENGDERERERQVEGRGN